MRKQRCMICHAWQRAGCRMAQPLVVLSITAVLVVHKLLSCLPYRATPSAAQTSCGAPLVSLLYTSKQSTEHITTWRELEIIARQTSPASRRFVCPCLRLNPPCCWDRGRKEADGGGKDSFFLDHMCACYWILMSELNRRAHSGWGQFSGGDSERKHGEEEKGLDEGDDEKTCERRVEVISVSTTLTLPCWCGSCSGLSWDPNHTAL